jgi:hypothetical protein
MAGRKTKANGKRENNSISMMIIKLSKQQSSLIIKPPQVGGAAVLSGMQRAYLFRPYHPQVFRASSAARGALFEKTAPLDPPQKLLIKGGHCLQTESLSMQTITAFGLFIVRRLKRGLKTSIHFVDRNFSGLLDILYFTAFAAGSIQLKKSSVGPKGLIGPTCHVAPESL